MTAKELKASILQLAVTGKLVPQDPNDEPVSVLLERIKAEKAKLIKAGKIKKDKNPSEIVTGSDGAVYEKFKDGTVKDISDELPFEIPDGWAWVRLSSVTEALTSGSRDWARYYSTKGDAFLRMGNLSRESFNLRLDKIQRVSLPKNAEGIRTSLYPGDLLFSITAEIGMLGLIPNDFEKAYINQHTARIRFIECERNRYLPFVMLSSYARRFYIDEVHGLKSSFRLDTIGRLLVPLPPLAEQKRIVAKIEKLMPFVEEYGKMEDERIQLDTDLPAALEKSILQEAIQGKLVSQDPNDEPASELLKRIATERKVLVKAGKLKRDKGEPVIFRGSDRLAYETRNGETVCIQDEIPFEIPDSWEWVRLGILINFVSGVSYDKDDVTKSGIRILRGGNIKGDGKLYLWEDDVFLPETYSNKENEIHKDDVVIVAATGSSTVIGRAAIAPVAMNGVQIGAFLRIARPLFPDINTWVALIFHSPFYRQHIQDKAKGTNIRNLKAEYITDFMIPLPPLAEQKRIVAKTEELRVAIKSLTT